MAGVTALTFLALCLPFLGALAAPFAIRAFGSSFTELGVWLPQGGQHHPPIHAYQNFVLQDGVADGIRQRVGVGLLRTLQTKVEQWFK